MGLISGLDAIEEQKEKSSNRKDVNRIKLDPGEAIKIRFVQELDKSHKNYDEKYGAAVVAVERAHPHGDWGSNGKLWWLRLVDRFEEDGADWAAEQGWKPKTTLYANVVDVDTGEIYLFERSVFSSLAESVIETAKARKTVTESVFRISKNAKGNYGITVVDLTDEPLDVDPDDLYDISEIVRNIPYAEQEEYVKEIEKRVLGDEDADDADAGDGDDDELW